MIINKGVSNNVTNSRETIQRIKILEYLRSVHTHPTAETVYKNVKKKIPTITLATVYRNLNVLAENFKILRLEINKEYHYDGDIRKHQHCVCRKCGKIIDIFREDIDEYALENIDKEKFNAQNVQVTYYGTCKKCGGKQK